MFLSKVAQFFLVTLCGAILTSCATSGSQRISELDRSLGELRRVAIGSLPLGLREVSPNQREYFSKYFVLQGSKFVPAPPVGSRYYAQIYLLGDRRPYTLEIIVHAEKGSPGNGYSESSDDKGLAKVIRRRAFELLNKRREDTDIIDDFRAF